MKILVTGSNGLIGSYLFKKLSGKHEVLGLDLKPSPYTNVVGDIRDFSLVKKLASKVGIVIHCAAQTSVTKSVEEPLFDAKNNIIGTLNLLEAARRSERLKRFIYISSAAVYGSSEYVPIDERHPCRPVSPYGVSKLTGELYARVFHEVYEVPTVCIRPFNVYGGGQSGGFEGGVVSIFLDRIGRGLSLILYGDGKQARDFIHVEDIANMIALCVESDEAIGEVFNCGTGRETSINRLAEMMIVLSGREVKIERLSEGSGDIRRSCANIRKAEKVLGFKPKISLEEGLKDVLNGS